MGAMDLEQLSNGFVVGALVGVLVFGGIVLVVVMLLNVVAGPGRDRGARL